MLQVAKATTNNTSTMSAPVVTWNGDDKNKYKVIVIGDSGVGKTALTFRFSEGLYRYNNVTVGVDIRVKKVKVDNEIVTLSIWDTAGMERHRMTLMPHYYRDLHAVIIVYDVTNEVSFKRLSYWLNEVDNHITNDVIKVIIGNKCDEDAVVSRQRAQQFADTRGIPLFETSAKLDTEKSTIDGIFLTIAHKLKENCNLIVNNNALHLQHHPIEAPPSKRGCTC